MKELEEKTIAALKEGPSSINALRIKIACNKNRLIVACKKLIDEGTVKETREGTRKILTLQDGQRTISEGFEYLRKIKKLVQYHLKAIEDLKKEGKKLEQREEGYFPWIHPEPKKHVDIVLELINDLNDICASYKYLHVFGYAKEYSKKEFDKLQKEVEFFTNGVLRNLKSHTTYFYQGYIGSEIFLLNRRIKLDQYFKEYNL